MRSSRCGWPSTTSTGRTASTFWEWLSPAWGGGYHRVPIPRGRERERDVVACAGGQDRQNQLRQSRPVVRYVDGGRWTNPHGRAEGHRHQSVVLHAAGPELRQGHWVGPECS